MSTPGRTCPLDYRTHPAELATTKPLVADTAYVIGGLYGNLPALEAIQTMAAAEANAGLPRPHLIFNGDFNWFNVDAQTFAEVNKRVLTHTAIQGNVEAEIARPLAGAGCGCAYPGWVDDGTVERSNSIMLLLQACASAFPDLKHALFGLPRLMTLTVGGLRAGVVHGDPESLAGWGLALEAMPPTGGLSPTLSSWFQASGMDILASSHTCSPFMQDVVVNERHCLIMNNGSAGMPNFSADLRGLISRISVHPSPHAAHYGMQLAGVYCDAIPVQWEQQAWLNLFDANWPAGSPAALSYRSRLMHGPEHDPDKACRLHKR